MEPDAAPLRWVHHEITDRLSLQLGLPNLGQDWDVIAANGARLDEFCDLYESGAMDADSRFAMMELIVASLDDLMSAGQAQLHQGERVERLLQRDFLPNLHTIHYWCCFDAENEDEVGDDNLDPSERVFPVTPMMRRIWADSFRPAYQRWIEKY